jgi:hypothetical protein
MKYFYVPIRVMLFIKFTLVIALGGCFNISDIYQDAFDKFTSSDVTKFINMGSQIILEKNYFMKKEIVII